LYYPTEVYKDETKGEDKLVEMYTNEEALCPITEEIILKSDERTPANTLERKIFYKDN